MTIRAAILCGGSGTRLWPLSRDEAPKQFQALVGTDSLLTQTVKRAMKLPDAGAPFILTGGAFANVALAHAVAGGAPDAELLLEPAARNTAPAAALAALAAAEVDPSTVIVLLASDHFIADEAGFVDTIVKARALAADGAIVTLGIVPDSPQTGYGYIRTGTPLEGGFKVDRFVEKPDAATAREFLQSGRYLWNAGIFIFRADTYLNELRIHDPAMAAACEKAWLARRTEGQATRVDPDAWQACPNESIDVTDAERTDKAAVVPADIGWSDVGSWSALMALEELDTAGNALFGTTEAINASNCYVRATSRHVAVIGVSDLIVVETGDAILIVHKDSTQGVKQAAESFKRRKAAANG